MLENSFSWISWNWQNGQKIKVTWHCHCNFILNLLPDCGQIVEIVALSRVLLAVFLKSFNQLHDEVPELCCDWFRGMQNFRIPVVPSYAHSYADVLGVSKNYEPVSCIKIKFLFLQGIIKDMIENPEKYPLTPVKVPIENPYYVPKPVSVESLKLMQNLSSLRKSKSQN